MLHYTVVGPTTTSRTRSIADFPRRATGGLSKIEVCFEVPRARVSPGNVGRSMKFLTAVEKDTCRAFL
jgi:hypothetical protein